MNAKDETIAALTKSVGDIDASRRVGWAKSFTATGKIKDLEQQVISLTYQRDLFRRVASYMDGFMKAQSDAIGCGTVPEALARYARGLNEYLEDGAFRQGQREGKKALEDWAGITDVQIKREALKREQGQRRKADNREFRDAMRSLAAQYHFNSVSEMRDYLKANRETK